MHPLANCPQARCCLDQRLASASWQPCNPTHFSQENLEKNLLSFLEQKKSLRVFFFPGKQLPPENHSAAPTRLLVQGVRWWPPVPRPNTPRFAGKQKNTHIHWASRPSIWSFPRFFLCATSRFIRKGGETPWFLAVRNANWNSGQQSLLQRWKLHFSFKSHTCCVVWSRTGPKIAAFFTAWLEQESWEEKRIDWNTCPNMMEKTQQSREHGTLSANMKSARHEKRSLAVVSLASCWRPPSRQRTQPGPRVKHHLGNDDVFPQ